MEKSIAKENRLVVFSNAMEEDMISKLPDSLISHMLLYLPKIEAVRTSVLSHRWKTLWLLMPALDVDTFEFPHYDAFVNFMDTFMGFSKEHKSCLHMLKLSIRKDENDDKSCLTRWIDVVATSKLQHLDVECLFLKPKCLEMMPLSLYICKTLHYLRLHRVSLGSFEFVSLPCVKTMRLEQNEYANEAVMESLISSCPVLEDLGIVRRIIDNVKVLRVHSHTLTSLSIALQPANDEDEDEEFDSENSEIIIDAPRLKYLNLESDLSENKIIKNSSSLTKVNFLDRFYLRDNVVHKFFTSLSGVTDMKISSPTFEFIKYTPVSLPQFCALTCLEVELYINSVNYLPTFLASCPSLKSLILDFCYYSMEEQTRLLFVPHCLLSSLELVVIKDMLYYKRKNSMLLEITRYFVKNSLNLKKIVVCSRSIWRKESSVVLVTLFALARQSRTCQFLIC